MKTFIPVELDDERTNLRAAVKIYDDNDLCIYSNEKAKVERFDDVSRKEQDCSKEIEETECLCLSFDSIRIVFQDKCIRKTLFPEYGDKPLSFDQLVQEAKAEGYDGSTTILVIAEGPRYGEVYQYNNYGKNEWVYYGQTIGYA